MHGEHDREGALPRGRRRRRAGGRGGRDRGPAAGSGSEHVLLPTLRLGRGSVHSEHGADSGAGAGHRAAAARRPGRDPGGRRRARDPDRRRAARHPGRGLDRAAAVPLLAVGTGAGGRELPDQPNVLRVFLGEAERRARAAARWRCSRPRSTTRTRSSSRAVAARLLEHGALDVDDVPAAMKKGRPGTWLIVIADPEHADALARHRARGDRHARRAGAASKSASSWSVARVEVETPFGAVALKVATLPDGERAGRAGIRLGACRGRAQPAARCARCRGRARGVARAARRCWRLTGSRSAPPGAPRRR